MSAGPRTVSSRWIWIFWNGAAEESVAMAARGCRRRERGQREREGPVVVLERSKHGDGSLYESRVDVFRWLFSLKNTGESK